MAMFDRAEFTAHLKRAAKMGRNGDTLLGHYTKGDVVIPVEEIDAKTRGQLQKILGTRLARFTAGDKANSVNPKTKLPEFEDGGAGGGDPGGGGDSEGGGADPGGGTSGTAAGEHGAEKGAATGTDPSGIGAAGGSASSDSSTTGHLTSEDLLAAPQTNQATSPVGNTRTGEQFGPGVGGALASFFGYNVNPSAPTGAFSSSTGPLFGDVVAPGFNTNAVGTGIGLLGSAFGIPGLGTLANATGLSSGIGHAFGLADPTGSFGALANGSSRQGDSATGDLAAAGARGDTAAGASGGSGGNAGAGNGSNGADGGHFGRPTFGVPMTGNESGIPRTGTGAPAPPGIQPTGTPAPIAAPGSAPQASLPPSLAQYLPQQPGATPFSMTPPNANAWWQHLMTHFQPTPWGSAPNARVAPMTPFGPVPMAA